MKLLINLDYSDKSGFNINGNYITELDLYESYKYDISINSNKSFWISKNKDDTDLKYMGNGNKKYELPFNSSIRNQSDVTSLGYYSNNDDIIYQFEDLQIENLENLQIAPNVTQNSPIQNISLGAGVTLNDIYQRKNIDYTFDLDIFSSDGLTKADYLTFNNNIGSDTLIRVKRELYPLNINNNGTNFINVTFSPLYHKKVLYLHVSDYKHVLKINILPVPENQPVQFKEFIYDENIKANYPLFESFMDLYFKHEGQRVKSSELIRNFLKYRDIDETLNAFIKKYNYMFLNNIPDTFICDNILLLKTIKSFYSVKGTKKSFKFLMKILYNETLELWNPKSFILRTSDNLHLCDSYMYVENQSLNFLDNDFTQLNGYRIRGIDSYAEATIIDVIVYNNVIELKLDNIIGDFIINERLEILNFNVNDIIIMVKSSIVGLIIKNSDVGFIKGERLYFDNVVNAVVKNVNSLGAITEIQLYHNENDIGDFHSIGVNNITLISEISNKDVNVDLILSPINNINFRFIDNSSFLNSNMVIQDCDFWQLYSYVIDSKVFIYNYGNIFNNIVTPSGIKLYGRYLKPISVILNSSCYTSSFKIITDDEIKDLIVNYVDFKTIKIFINDKLLNSSDYTYEVINDAIKITFNNSIEGGNTIIICLTDINDSIYRG